MCLSEIHCVKGCPTGQKLDPRDICVCISEPDYDSLFSCEPPVQDNFTCDANGKKICKAEEKCEGGFYWDDEAC